MTLLDRLGVPFPTTGPPKTSGPGYADWADAFAQKVNDVLPWSVSPSGGSDTAALSDTIAKIKAAGGGPLLIAGALIVDDSLLIDFDDIHFMGFGEGVSSITNIGTTDLFVFSGTHFRFRWSDLAAISGATSGDIFAAGTAELGQCHWDHITAVQNNPAKHVLYGSDVNYIGNHWSHYDIQGTLSHTTPLMKLVVSSGGKAINANTWHRGRFTNSGQFSLWIECDTPDSYASDNTIQQQIFEDTLGGNIALFSCRGSLLEMCTTNDLGGTTTNDLVYIGRGAATPTPPAKSADNVLRQVQRRGSSSLGAGLSDIRLKNGQVTDTTIEECNGLINLDLTTGVNLRGVATGLTPATTITNKPAACTDVRSDAIYLGPDNLAVRRVPGSPEGAGFFDPKGSDAKSDNGNHYIKTTDTTVDTGWKVVTHA